MSEEPSRLVRAACVAAAVLPIVAAVGRALRHGWHPVGDAALLAIRVRDVATGHHPLLGSWTSASLSVGRDINNPGPLYQDLAAPLAKLVAPGGGVALAVGLLNVLAVVGISAAARHVGGWSLQRWSLLAAAALSWSMGSELLIDIWQPHALLLPFVAFLFLLLGIAECRGRCVPWAVLVGSLLVQTHIGYAYVVAAFVPVAAVLAWLRSRPMSRHAVIAGLRTRTTSAAVVVGVLVWTQPVVDQLVGAGNLGALLASSGGGERTLGWSQRGEDRRRRGRPAAVVVATRVLDDRPEHRAHRRPRRTRAADRHAACGGADGARARAPARAPGRSRRDLPPCGTARPGDRHDRSPPPA